MTFVLVRKTLRDVRLWLIVTMALLFVFQLLWARVTARLIQDVLATLGKWGVSIQQVRELVFQKEGAAIQKLIGGDTVEIDRAFDTMTVAFVHPMTQLVLCMWAIGRASGAIAGEIDRGTMELLLSQPIRRTQVMLAHLLVDCIAIPLICLAMWFGNYLGTWMVGFQSATDPRLYVNSFRFLAALPSVAGLIFAVGGLTMWASAAGRSRTRVLGFAAFVILLQFLVNLLGQMWAPMEVLRPFTIFRWYEPQKAVLNANSLADRNTWIAWAVLFGVGLAGWLLATLRFRRRDLPAPL